MGSFQNMLSDLIRAGGWVGVEDRATIKAVVRVQAWDGLTIAASFLEAAGRNSTGKLQTAAKQTQSKHSPLSSA